MSKYDEALNHLVRPLKDGDNIIAIEYGPVVKNDRVFLTGKESYAIIQEAVRRVNKQDDNIKNMIEYLEEEMERFRENGDVITELALWGVKQIIIVNFDEEE